MSMNQEHPNVDGLPFERYALALRTYLETRAEAALYEASELSRIFVEREAGPDEIVALHFESLDGILRHLNYRQHMAAVTDAHQFLLEVMIAYGVTYREYLDLKLREHQRDQTARDELLATIAHELRSPLAAAQANVDMAKRNLAKGRVELIEPNLGGARGALDRLSRLTANLVRSAHSASLLSVTEPVDLRTILDQACDWASLTADEKAIALERALSAPGEVIVCGDPDGLLSVFGNLISNAIRYTESGGRVSITMGRAERAWVEIRDTGIGMSPDVQARIFDRFYRGPQARSMESHGLGLGLTLVALGVEAHDGVISVESTPLVGSMFRVELPLAPANGCEGERMDA
jgi:signal transduction histidine kinase